MSIYFCNIRWDGTFMEETPDLKGIYLGTSGWSYLEWKGIVYPENLPQSKMFQYYSEFFYTAEINSTFYQIPSSKTAQIWAERSPNYFKFSAKIPKIVTHENKLNLRNCLSDLTAFLRNITPLFEKNKVLALLLQLPPSFGNEAEQDYKKLENFAKYWDSSVRDQFESMNLILPEMVVEFRNKFWMRDEIFELLRNYNLVYCAVVEPLLPPRLDITNENLFYIRFHGYGKRPWFNYNFSEEQLSEWSGKLKPIVDAAKNDLSNKKKVALYFNNHFSGYAVKNALTISKKMDLPHKNGLDSLMQSLERLIKAKEGSFDIEKSNKKKQKHLDEFF